jgi:alkanesulfonate monooxygenase SsuD/methylene tetrahydromethanopterin reductase-like flavin-dependent oxidoreductase (luciferase family)
MEIGIYTFAELRGPGVVDPDQVGLDVFGVGEHHRPDFAVSAPTVVLGAAAAATKTVLSSADPVRVFQEFATLDLLSGGRAEIMAGRGSFIESFPLFSFVDGQAPPASPPTPRS